MVTGPFRKALPREYVHAGANPQLGAIFPVVYSHPRWLHLGSKSDLAPAQAAL